MAGHGGFEHNLQSLRVVDTLEQRYPDFDGLNLTFETREGILKHCSQRHAQLLEAQEPNGVAARFLRGEQPSLEAQLANLADAIAYNAHDVDDGVRSGLITLEQLQAVPLFAHYHQQALAQHPHLAQPEAERRLLYACIRLMLSDQVYDVIATTQTNLARTGVASVHDVRQCGQRLVAFSAEMHQRSQALKTFLLHQLYRHPQVMHTMEAAQQVVRELFAHHLHQPDDMPARFAQRAAQAADEAERARAVADFIAGMTDRYAISTHTRLTGQHLLAQ